jgi:hypothetical protein
MPNDSALAVGEQIINAFVFIDNLLAGTTERERFRVYARRVLQPVLHTLGTKPKQDEPVTVSLLRATLIQQLGLFGDNDIIELCRHNFDSYQCDPATLAPDLRAPTFAVVTRFGDGRVWQQLHELGLKTASTEEKQNYYDALAFSTDPVLIKQTLAIALTDELPTSRAVYLVGKVARESDRPDLAWDFAKTNFKALLAKVDSLGANSYFPSLCTFFSDPARIDELQHFARKNLSEASAKPVEIAADEIRFRADFKRRVLPEIGTLASP